MTTQQAKELLAAYRPGTEDERDPIFAEALALARSNAELKAWLDESVAFDRAMKTELTRVPAPEALRTTILLEKKIVKVRWWDHRLSQPQWAAAAALILLAAVASAWFGYRTESFADFRREIAERSWTSSWQIEEGSDMAEVRRRLEKQGLASTFPLPPTLSESDLRGYTVVQWRGHRVPVLCFSAEGEHLHLVVTDRKLFPDAPEIFPQMDQGASSVLASCSSASWSKNNFSYVLTGMKTYDFVKRFRKDKRWDWES